MSDTFSLMAFLGQLEELRIQSPRVFLNEERKRTRPEISDAEEKNNPPALSWDDFGADELSAALGKLLTDDDKRDRHASIAVLSTFGITPETVFRTIHG